MKKLFLVFTSTFLISFSTLAQSSPAVKHVVMVGFGAYALPKADMPNLKQMMKEGSYTLKNRSVLPSSSAVNWASMLMGASPTLHGYTEWGSQTPEIPSAITNPDGLFPSIYSQIKEQNPSATTAAIYSWGGIGYLLEKKAVDINIATKDDDDKALQEAIRTIKESKPTFTFIHLDEPDGVGHSVGHDTPEYYEELKKTDKQIGQLQQAIIDVGIASETLFIVVSDHGGIDKGHGGKTLAEVEVPWVMTGPGIAKGKEVQEPTIVYDLAPTIAWALGIDAHPVWRGKAVRAFF